MLYYQRKVTRPLKEHHEQDAPKSPWREGQSQAETLVGDFPSADASEPITIKGDTKMVHVFDNGEWKEYTYEEFFGTPVYDTDINTNEDEQ